MSEADVRYLVEIREDCSEVLGAGMELLELEREEDRDGVRLIARYRLEDRVWESAATGDTIVAAHAELRARLLFDRIRLGFTTLTQRP